MNRVHHTLHLAMLALKLAIWQDLCIAPRHVGQCEEILNLAGGKERGRGVVQWVEGRAAQQEVGGVCVAYVPLSWPLRET